MKIIVEGTNEEIAALVLAIQERRTNRSSFELMIGDKSVRSILENLN